jgi:hypothetical protein
MGDRSSSSNERGGVTDNWHWTYNQTWAYGYTTNGTNVPVGSVQLAASITFNGRQLQLEQKSGSFAAPRVFTDNEWNCVDEGLLNTSCSAGWQSRADEVGGQPVFKLGWFVTNDKPYLRNNDQYHMDLTFQYFWQAEGYSYVWNTSVLTSTLWHCRDGRDAQGACQFG